MNKYPILSNGELLGSPVSKKQNSGLKKYPTSLTETKENLISDINKIRIKIKEKEFEFSEEIVLCARMHEKFLAKSYVPSDVFNKINIEIVGGRGYHLEGGEYSKLYFIKTSSDALDDLENKIKKTDLLFNPENDESEKYDTFQKNLLGIKSIDTLDDSEKIQGFKENFESYKVEIVIHPLSNHKEKALEKVKEILELEKITSKDYENGPLFISAKINNFDTINRLAKLNFLRSIHPIGNIDIPEIRSEKFTMPIIPSKSHNPLVKVGVFDGGTVPSLLMFQGLVNNFDCVIEEPLDSTLAHGTAVCGAVLYGNIDLENISNKNHLVSVDSYRVLPTSNPLDFDLYEVIDAIEKIVIANTDTFVYNISLGPNGPILDDNISRFTFVLDKLAYEENVIFCVAVGNDGKTKYNRIQAPSDLVNGLGIGAYTFKDTGELIKAPYSCIGQGREGAKIKPDLLAFGGCSNHPFKALALDNNQLSYTAGTSFASPIIAGTIARMMARSPEISPQLAKSLLILSTKTYVDSPKIESGFGFFNSSEEEVLNCTGTNEVVIVYKGEIKPGKYVKLDIPLPKITNKGTIEITSVLSMASSVSSLDSDFYTNNSIEDFFYPNSNKYSFTKEHVKKVEKLHLIKDEEKIKELILLGYKKSDFPQTDSNKFKKPEQERRKDFVWDTVTKRQHNKRTDSIESPFFILHGQGRTEKHSDNIKYALAVKIKIKNYDGLLYDDIRNKFPVLTPLKLRNSVNIEIKL